MDTNTSALPKRNRHRLLTIALIALIVIAVASVIATSVIIFNRTTRELREETIVSTARLAAAQIDGDRVNGWLANGKDAEYAKTAKVLEDICTTHRICSIFTSTGSCRTAATLSSTLTPRMCREARSAI